MEMRRKERGEEGKRRTKERKGKRKEEDHEAMGRAPAAFYMSKTLSKSFGSKRKGRKIPGGNRENKLAFLDPAKAPPKSKVLTTQPLSRQRHAFIRMLVGCLPNGETVVTTWSTHDDVP